MNYFKIHITQLKLFLTIITLILFSYKSEHRTAVARWVVKEGSILRVDGLTNINCFICDIVNYNNLDTITFYDRTSNSSNAFMKGKLSVNINDFNCHNLIKTNELRKTLKQKENDCLFIHFASISKIPSLSKTPELLSGIVNIELKGVVKPFNILYKIYLDDNNIIHLQGTKTLKFTDFNITPPSSFAGMIKTKNELQIFFDLKCAQ